MKAQEKFVGRTVHEGQLAALCELAAVMESEPTPVVLSNLQITVARPTGRGWSRGTISPITPSVFASSAPMIYFAFGSPCEASSTTCACWAVASSREVLVPEPGRGVDLLDDINPGA